MTREEASFILANIDRRVCDDELNEALDIAIEALETEPCEDSISREAILLEIDKIKDNYGGLLDVAMFIRGLPSVSPQPRTEQEPCEKFESAKDHIYKLAGDYKCWDNRLTDDEALELVHILEQQPCDDCISRQAVLNIDFNRIIHTTAKPVEMIRQKIEQLPPVTPQPKTGHCKDCKWWKDSDGVYRRGVGHRCPINTRVVFEGNGYCYKFEPQKSEG